MRKSDIDLKVGGRSIAASVYTRQHPEKAMLFVHGYGSNRKGYNAYASAVASSDKTMCMTIDLGGHGQSGKERERFTINDHLLEMRRAHDYLALRVDPSRISIGGASYGGALAVLLSEQMPVSGLLLRAPALYPDGLEDIPRHDYNTAAIDQFRQELDPPPPNRALEAVARFAGPIVLVRSEFDESIPPNVIDAYESVAQRAVVHEIPGASHALKGDERTVFERIAVDFAQAL